MNANDTIEAVKQFCKTNSGNEQMWNGNKATYHWNLGKVAQDGVVNGVVRKLAGIDAAGGQLWSVAGSFKIQPNGDISRFTGMPGKFQKQIMLARTVFVDTKETVTV